MLYIAGIFMEFKAVVYNAVRDGNLKRLKLFIDLMRPDDVKRLLSPDIEPPPLVIACRNGHLEIVRYLVKKGADVELAGNVTFEGETIEKAPPLWCASAAGHLDIVKTLVSYGASVNNTTATLSTPLRAACFDGHLAIVQYLVDHGGDLEQANRHGHTCLMIACYRGHLSVVKFLLASSADVNRRSLKGNTALHDCAEAGRLEILKELLKHGAIMQRDSFGLTPILGAAAVGHACVVEYLSLESFQVCDLIDACSEEDQINALELLGATFVDKKRDIGKAIRFWNLALEIRGHFDHPKSDIVTHDLTESSEVCDPVLDSLSADESFKRCRLNAYEDVIEFMSLDDLNNMRSDPDQLRIQALLIRERILGYKHPDTAYFIRYRGAVFADFGRFDRCIALWMYALAIHQKMWEPLCAITQGNFISFAEVFAFMLNNESINAERHKRIQFDDVFRVLLRAVHELRRAFKLCDNDMKRSCSEASNTASVSPSTSTEQPINRGVACVPPCVHWNDQLNDLSANDFTDSDTSLSAQKRTENRCQRLHRMSMITLHLVCIVTKIDCSLLDADRERLCKLIYQLIQIIDLRDSDDNLRNLAEFHVLNHEN